MLARRLTPILNVSNIQESFAWFEKLGWTKAWDWGAPPTFGGVCSGECEIFLCQNGQGGRGKSGFSATFGPESNEAAEKAVWMSIWVTTLTRPTNAALSKALRSRGLQRTCRGMLGRCTYAIRTDTYLESAAGLRRPNRPARCDWIGRSDRSLEEALHTRGSRSDFQYLRQKKPG